MRTIQTTYRYRLEPTAAQAAQMRQFAGARRFVWNWALARTKAHYQKTGKRLSSTALMRELTGLKQQPATAWLREMHAQLLQQALRDLESAFQAFFRRVKASEPKKGHPKFKSKKTDIPRFRMPQDVRLEGIFVRVPKIGLIKAIVHRPVAGVTKGATFKQEPDGHWYVCFVVEQVAPARQPQPVRSHVGVDVGLKSFGVFSNGETIANPRFCRTQMRKLARAQRALSRKQKGGRNRSKARVRVARLYQKVASQRKDFLHKLSADLVRRFDLISIEDLAVRGLARTKLSAGVLDAGWGLFRSFLSYKADRSAVHLMLIGRFFPSSRLCGACGRINADLALSDRTWVCECGAHLDRDLNAACNIDGEGVRLYQQQFFQPVAVGHTETQNACGALVSPATTGARC